MGWFDKQKGPVFLKEDSEAVKERTALQKMYESAPDTVKKMIEQELRQVETGIIGEQHIRFELENSHIPMYILHDLYLAHEGLSAQIDYLVVTRKHCFIIECKNLYGNLEINNNGDFIRTVNYGKSYKKEGIYSPITQNQRHLELIKAIRSNEMSPLKRPFFEMNFNKNYRSIVVLANPKTVLHDRYAPKEIRQKVIRADQLVSYIQKVDGEADAVTASEKSTRELAEFFLNLHSNNPKDYTAKFQTAIKEELNKNSSAPLEKQSEQSVEPCEETMICPRCGASMIKRIAKKGQNAGNTFYGCSNYPKCRAIINIKKNS